MSDRNMNGSPYLVTFAAGGNWQTFPCDTDEEVETAVKQAKRYGGERGIVIWDRRESRATK